jgi:ribosomal subunit interface protein
MKLSISFRHIESLQTVEAAVTRHIRKISKLLTSYAPDLVQLRGHFAKQPRRTEFSFSVTLSLPNGTLHATAAGTDPKVSAHDAFVELEAQIKKHQSRLRKESAWKSRRAEKALA